jgi:hypothetical protein
MFFSELFTDTTDVVFTGSESTSVPTTPFWVP